MSQEKRIFLIAGEASGDQLGASLMENLLMQKPAETKIEFLGIGGPAMERQGLSSLFGYQELSVMGWLEIVKHLPRLKRRFKETLQAIKEMRPHVIISIDSPGFTTRIAKQLRKHMSGIPLIHVVAPSVWAYKPGRAAEFAELFDHLMVLFPFEPPYFEAEGLACNFIGHPMVSKPFRGDAKRFRAYYGLDPAVPIMVVLPGSREAEVRRLLPVFLKACHLLAARIAGLHVVIPTTKAMQPFVISLTQNPEGLPIIITTDEQMKHDSFSAATLALAKSGTVSLELAKARLSHVTAHQVHPFTAWLLRHIFKIQLSVVNLVNILNQKLFDQSTPVIPEYLQERCIPSEIAKALESVWFDEQKRAEQQEVFSKILDCLKPNKGDDPYAIISRYW